MREMKETGIPWLPEVAEYFSVRYVKQYFYVSKDLSNEGEPERVLKLARAGIVEKDVTTNEGQMAASYAGYNKVQVGDLLLNPMDLYSGANCNVSELNGVISPAYSNLRAKKAGSIVPKFYDYYFKCQYWLMAMFAHGKGVSFENRWTLNNDSLRSYEIPVVPYAVQGHIVERIQSEERKVDALIANMQAQIEKLKAYKQSLITEVVTKGLDPSVPMKDSEVEWIGCYPNSWRLSHIGKVAEMGAGGTPSRNNPEYWDNGSIPWMSSGEINYEYVYDTSEKITELGMKNSNAKLLPINTVMLGLIGQGRTKGLSAILKIECTCNQNLAYLIANPTFLHYEYLFYCFKAMYSYIRGVVGESQAGIYQGFLKMQYIPLPSTSEQIMISNYLNEKCSQIDHLIAIKQAKIEKLEQYKRSLIYEYVTGKKEVR